MGRRDVLHAASVGPGPRGQHQRDPFDLANPDGWSAQASIGIKRSNGASVNDATVSGRFTANGGYSFTGSCVTVGAGFCSINASGIPQSANQVTFSVTSVEHPEGYDPSANARTTITITKPAG